MTNQENKPLTERVKDIRDHAYRIGEGHLDHQVAIMLPLIDMLAELALAGGADSGSGAYEYDTKFDSGLNCATRDEGWEFVETVINDMPMNVIKNISVPNQSWPSQVTDQEMMRTTRYLLRRLIGSPVTTALARATAAEAEARKAKDELRESCAKLETSKYDLQRANDRSNSLNTLANDRYEELQEAEKRKRQLEVDIAKIRSALGAIKMKEILG